MKRKGLVWASAFILLVGVLFFSAWLYDKHKDMQLYEQAVIDGYENTLRGYEYLLTLQRDIINEEDEELQARLIALYEDFSWELHPQRNTGELLKLFYVKNNPDSAIPLNNIADIGIPFAHSLHGDSEEEWMANADDFERAIEQMREQLEVIKTELDLPPDEA